MDIFVRNIPDQASSKNLESFFREHFKPFGIYDFCCQKLRSRGCAILTVLDAGKAQRFLNVYGVPSQSRDEATKTQALKYLNRDVFCSPSKSKCDEVLLETLRKEAKDKGNQLHNRSSAPGAGEQLNRAFDYTLVRCGHWDYQASDLVFISQHMDKRMGSIKFGKKNLALVSYSNVAGMYRLDIPYSSILFITIGSVHDPSLTLTLSEAPRVYQESTNDPNSLQSLFSSLSLQTRAPTKQKRIRVASLGGVHESVISGCFVYRVLITNPSQLRQISALLRKGREMPSSIPWPTAAFTPRSPFVTEMGRLTLALHNQYNLLDFRLQFQVQRLAQNGYLTPARVLELLPHVFQVSVRSGGRTTAEAVRKLSRQLPYAGPEVDGKRFAVDNLNELLIDSEKAMIRELSHHTKPQHLHIGLVHKAIVTPAGIYLEGPEPETTNRVLRAYADHADHFLRVTFSDEDGERVRFDRFVSFETIFHTRFKSVLDGVISIAGRRFAFLGFSHSSLRDQTCWFMAPFEHHGVVLNATTVIAQLGDFSAIRSPAKCAARIGQAFSTTDGAVKIPLAIVGEIPDIERNGRVFSDGVGTISAEVLAMLRKDYTPARNYKPTLYQIRFAGTWLHNFALPTQLWYLS
jgi:RNA dependent RNA polymerase